MMDALMIQNQTKSLKNMYIDTDESLLSLLIFHDDSLVREG